MIDSILSSRKNVDWTDYLAVDLNNESNSSSSLQLAHLRVSPSLGPYEETCNKNMGLLLHSSFRQHRISGDYWLPTRYIPGRTLSQELSDPNSRFKARDLYNMAAAELDRLHRSGYYHSSAHPVNFRVNGKTGTVHLVNFRLCGKLGGPYSYVLSRQYTSVRKDYDMLTKYLPLRFRNKLLTSFGATN